MVTTKRGEAGKTKVNFDAYYGTQKAWRQLDLLNVDQYLAYGRDLQTNGGQPVPARFDDLRPFANVHTDWQDAMFNPAPIQNYNLSLSGGTDKATFMVSGGYFKQDGIMLGTGFERYSFRANSDFKIGERVKIGQSLMVAHTSSNVEPFSGGRSQIEHIIKSVPYIPIYDPTRVGGFRATDQVDGSDPENPVLNAKLRSDVNADMKLLGNVYAEVSIIDGLKYRFQLGLDMDFNNDDQFTPIFDAGDYSKNPTADIQSSNSKYVSPIVTNQLSYQKQFGKHNIDATAVYEVQTSKYRSFSGVGENSLTSDIQVLNGVESPSVSGSENEYALISYIGRLNYDYAGKYLLSASIRRDGGSRFGPTSKWGTFPSVSAGWRISEEQFMSSVSAISDLKLRASYGEMGNDQIGDYRYQATINGNFKYNFDNNLETASTINSLANEDVHWETTKMTNVGLAPGAF